MATDSVARAIALAGLANGGGGGLSTIVAGTGTSSIVMNHDDTNTNAATGNYSTALGYGTKAMGKGALAAGYSQTPGNVMAGEGAVCCIGRATGTGAWKAIGTNSIAIGSKSDSSNKVYGADINSIAIGFNVSAFVPAAPVVTVPTCMVAARPSSPLGPAGPGLPLFALAANAIALATLSVAIFKSSYQYKIFVVTLVVPVMSILTFCNEPVITK